MNSFSVQKKNANFCPIKKKNNVDDFYKVYRIFNLFGSYVFS